ncbi:MAG: isopeptide-forming domain-containing fimbrial protein, partial [Gammaproteobacteria bacterium]|nr:isopeptide-forming domain-containing fimbrial protein [Gammaproteobacteria bacterium]
MNDIRKYATHAFKTIFNRCGIRVADRNVIGSSANMSTINRHAAGHKSSRLGSRLLLLLALLLGGLSQAQAGEFCVANPQFNGVIDGTVTYTSPPFETITQITIDGNCTFKNFTASNPLSVTINFQTNDPSIYLISFDNVVSTKNMACSNIDHKLWVVNSTGTTFDGSCQDIQIPTETIDKQAPASTVGIGDPFTYTLTLPSMNYPLGDPSLNELRNVILWDDISAAATGADLTLVGVNAYYKGSGTPVTLVPEDQPQPTSLCGIWTPKNLCYKPIPFINPGEQIMVEIEVYATAANVVGTTFVNTAKWWFGRDIDIDGDGIITPEEQFTPLPGEWGISQPMIIAEPNLVVTKSSTETALNLGIPATFTIDVQNNGGSDAWHVTILDQLPDFPTAGTCDTDLSTSIIAQVFAADGVSSVSGLLAPGFDYSVGYSGAPTCELSLTMLTAKAVIAPTERLIITYDTQLDADTTGDGLTLTNVAGATEWFSGNGSYPRLTYSKTLTDGTPAIVDHEDSYTITTALSGYYFQKTVQNLTTGANPATNAVPSDTLRYRLRVFNVDETIDTITITDTLDPTKFDTSTFSMIAFPPGSTFSFNDITGELRVFGFPDATSLNVSQGSELIVDFEIDLAAGLSNGDVVPNQATLSADGPLIITSDDPYVNGIAAPGDLTDPTNVVIQAPGPLAKVKPVQTTASIGEQFTYTITVPAVAVNVPLYDVRITDDLTASNADLSFVSATLVSGGSWVLSNTGTATNVVIEDTATGIDIAANSQAVIEITVELQNTLTNQAGLTFNNIASFTYNRSNGDIGTQTLGSSGSSANMTVIEPAITTITKTADKTTPTAGEIVRYSVTLDTNSGADFSDVFDVTITDSLSAGLVYEGNPTVTVGAGVSADNTIGAPDITGDGSAATPQILVWSLGNADIDIVEGTSLTISYDVRVLNSVLANQTLTNSVVVQWSNIDGVSTGERSGIDGVGGLNDYITAAVSVSVTTPDIISTITKIRSSDTYGAGDDDVRIGDLVEYELRIAVPEGTLGNLQLVDTLPQGLKYEGIVSINGNVGPAPYTAVAPFSHTDVLATDVVEAGDAITGSTTVTWSLSDITNLPNDGLSDDFIILYRARVVSGVLAQTNSTVLNNSVSMSYDTATGTVTSSDTDTIITVLQPVLTVSKSAAAAGVDSVVDASELVNYTVDIVNNGSAPAYDVVLQDIIPVGMRDGVATVTMVSTTLVVTGSSLTNPTPSYDAATGIVIWNLDSGIANTYTIPAGETLRIEYQVQVDAIVAGGLTLINSAQVSNYYSFDDEAIPTLGTVTGVREVYGITNTATTTLYTGAAPTKALLSSTTATIGEDVVYQITVPGTLSSSALHDVQVIDTLDTNLEFISATVTGGGVGVTDNSTTSPSVMDISITEIPAGQQVVIELRARVANVATAQQGVAVNNTASYTYAYTSGGATQSALTSTDIVTVNIIEPNLTVAKAVTLVTAAPVTGGDVLEYVLTIPNTGNATAYDVNIVDTLAAQLTLDTSFTPTAAIDTVAVVGFNATPSGSPSGPLVWGQDNGDGSLDIPAGSTLLLTYRVVIAATAESNITLSNSVQADWTTLNGTNANERTGAGCPTVIAPNDYCTVPAIASVTTADSNSFSKIVFEDSYIPVTDATVRIGDTVTYNLTLNFQEGTTRSVVVQDVLPTGLAFVDIVSINGDSVADYDPPASGGGSNFSYATVASASLPTAGQTGTLNFTLGNVVNDPLGDSTTDSITIFYRARVIENTLAQAASTALNNTATLTYIDGTGTAVIDPARLQSTATTTVLQPVMTTPTKVDSVFISPANVNIATDVMHFTLESCNTTGLAPAYNVQLTDVLATQLDETSIVGPTVTINGAAAVAGTDYTYTAPVARGGSMIFDLLTPVNAGQCVTINYDIGFYTDFGPNQTWNNSVTVDEYWSLPLQTGQQYASLGPTIFTMSNIATIGLPAKIMSSPASGEATIGEDVVYQITVPAVAVNAALYDVVISDTLHASLELISATDISGNGLSITDNTVANNVSLTIAQIPAGQQAVIELRTRVANNATANAATSFNNTISYTYATTSGGATLAGGSATTATSLTIIEPLIAINKTVVNNTNVGNPPVAGDVLRYSLTFTASGAGAGDNFADAFDLSIIDSLSLGLAYQTASATVDGGNTISDPAVVGDGSSTSQTLTWQLADATADIDVVEGTTVTVTYDVVVLDSVLANQTLTNSALAQWTSLDGSNVNERNGTATPAVNDYVTAAVITTLTTPDTTSLTKTHFSDTFGGADKNVRVGDIVEYELRVALQEGQHSNLVLTDTLPQGLAFESVAQINGDTTSPFTEVAPFVHGDITPVVSGDPATGSSNVTFTLGTVTNVSDNNAANDEFVIIYRARVLDSVHAQVNSITLTNNAQLDYTTASGAAQQTSSAVITLLQPNLAVTKLAAAVGGDTIINAGELVTYTVDVINSGTAPAYDVVVQDTIPVGMRNGAATITMVSTTLVNAATSLTNLTPIYDAATGVAIWDFDASIYSIAAGETLRIVYQIQADADLGAGLMLTNQVVGNNYYSFDDDATPTLGGINGVRETYSATNTATRTLTSPTPGALLKENPADLTVAVGETFTYRITVPATPLQIALHDVRIIDDLNASAADLTYLSVAKVSGSQPWTPENTGTAKNLIIEDTTNGIDIPAGEQVVIEITVVVDDTGTNVSGLLFSNTATYTYNQLQNDSASQQNGAASTTTNMTIVGPDNLTLTKTGSATIRYGVVETFTLNIQNTGTAPAWDITVSDILPTFDPAAGGMCDTAPTNITAQMYLADGTTTVGGPLVQGTDYVTSYSGCTLTLTMQSTAAALVETNRLIITYDAQIDLDTQPNSALTNIAGVTEWFSGDTAGAGATGQIKTFSRTVTNGTVGTLDHEDAFTTTSEIPTLTIEKRVVNITTGQDPGANASPGDTLRYGIYITNTSSFAVNSFTFTDDLDALNATAMFVAGSLNLITVPATADSSNTDVNGGSKGTGLVDIRNLSMGATGSGSETVVIEFEVKLVASIASGTTVYNQGHMDTNGLDFPTDDPNIGGATDPTETIISSAPQFEVFKTSSDLTGDANILLPGDTLRYTITVKNIGTEDAINVILKDQLPANTTYVAGSTTLNGSAVTEPTPGLLPLQSGILINAPEDTTAGVMRADATATTANIATITFNVTINSSVVNGTIISNQGYISASGTGSGAIADTPSDDPATSTLNDPTRDVIGNQPLLDA